MSGLRLIWKPSVYLVGRQAIDEAELGRFLEDIGAPDWTTDAGSAADAIAEISGRLCYESFRSPRPGGNAAYMGHILESGHGNVCEHPVFNFILAGISRTLSHELIRHRAGVSVSELSQRFVEMRDAAFVVPPALVDEVRLADEYLEAKGWSAFRWLVEANGPDGCDLPDDATLAGLRWLATIDVGMDAYVRNDGYVAGRDIGKVADRTLRRKRSREAARSSLAPCAETKVFMTANARALRNIIEQRGDTHADAEIRRLGVEIARVVKREATSIFQDLSIDEDAGTATTKHHKV